MIRYFIVLSFICIPLIVQAEKNPDSLKLKFTGEFLFRFEQDWNSRKSDGTFRTDRSRWRYRGRIGMVFNYNPVINIGLGLRTGKLNKQQDPQITIGDASGEFSNIPISFEKLYFQYKTEKFDLWLGKNTWPFRKLNELFWSDNVYPDGMYLAYTLHKGDDILTKLEFKSAYFIMNSVGGALNEDSNMVGFQFDASLLNERLKFFPSLYLFNNMDDIPDGAATQSLEYSIVHIGSTFNLIPKYKIHVDADLYFNLSDYSHLENIYSDQTNGMVLALRYGQLKNKGDKSLRVTYTRLERFSAVDYLAQNDWVRWDYSQFNSPDGRLTNYQGWELMLGFMINDQLKINTRAFIVEQLLSETEFLETGTRIRLDLDMKF